MGNYIKPDFKLIIVLMLSILTYVFSWIIGFFIALMYHEIYFEFGQTNFKSPWFLLSTFFVISYAIWFLFYPPLSMFKIQKGSMMFLMIKNFLNIMMFVFYIFFVVYINLIQWFFVFPNLFFAVVILIHIVNTYVHFELIRHPYFTKKSW